MPHNSIYTSNLTCHNKDFNKDFTPSPAGGGGFEGGPGKGIGAAFGAPVHVKLFVTASATSRKLAYGTLQMRFVDVMLMIKFIKSDLLMICWYYESSSLICSSSSALERNVWELQVTTTSCLARWRARRWTVDRSPWSLLFHRSHGHVVVQGEWHITEINQHSHKIIEQHPKEFENRIAINPWRKKLISRELPEPVEPKQVGEPGYQVAQGQLCKDIETFKAGKTLNLIF